MTAADILARGRAMAELLMVDTCTITRAGTGTGPWNNSTGQYDPPARVTVYTGKCRIQIKSVIASSSTAAAGERLVTTQEVEWQGPVVGTEGVAPRDEIAMDTVVSDAALVGRTFTVAAIHEKSQATSRRLRVTEGTS